MDPDPEVDIFAMNDSIINFTEDIENHFDMKEVKDIFNPISVKMKFMKKALMHFGMILMLMIKMNIKNEILQIIQGIEMKKFNCENFERMTGPMIDIKGIIFECIIAPNGNSTLSLIL